MTITEQIAALLKTRTWTVKQLVAETGMDQGQVSRALRTLKPRYELVPGGKAGPLAKRYGPLP